MDKIDIKQNFREALLSFSPPSPNFRAEDFLGDLCPQTELSADAPLRLLAGGRILTQAPGAYEVRALDCFLLLYTRSGSGKLRIEKQVYSLLPDSVLYLDCRQHFSLHASEGGWNYQGYFGAGSAFPFFSNLITPPRLSIRTVSPHSETALRLNQIELLFRSPSARSQLTVSGLLYALLTECAACRYPEETFFRIPPYIQALQGLFEKEYAGEYSLDELSALFQVNKYRLCREFRKAYGVSPIQYLNRRRILAAKNLLLTSNCKVHEAGRMVGIENTDHFILLFKKYTGETPAQYRRSHSAVL